MADLRLQEKSPGPTPGDVLSANGGAWRPCFVYVLGWAGSDRHLTYVGWTNDLGKRLARHNAGTGARSTRGRVWVLLHSERYATRQEAMSREWHLKRDRAFRKLLAKGITQPRRKRRAAHRKASKAGRDEPWIQSS